MFSIYVLTLLSPTVVHTRFNDNRLFLSFFYYCHYYFSLVFLYLLLLFTKWLCKPSGLFKLFIFYISYHPTSICSKLLLLPGVLLFTLSISLNKFLLVEIPGMKHLMYLVIVDFTFKMGICVCFVRFL